MRSAGTTKPRPPPSRIVVYGGIWLVCAALNLTKAVHIDDTAHLEIARHIAQDPLHPMSGEVYWSERPAPIHHLNQPHLFFYLLAATHALSGGSLLWAHAMMAAWTALALLLFAHIAQRLGWSRRIEYWLALALFLGLAWLPSQNLMTDIPMFTCWLGCFVALMRAEQSETRRARWLLLAGSCAAAAILIKYTSLVLLVPFWPVLRRSTHKLRDAALSAAPVAVALGAWSAFNLWDYGGIHLLGRPIDSAATGSAWLTIGLIFGRALLWILTLGAIAPFSLVFLPGTYRELGARRLLLTIAVPTLLLTLGGQLAAHYGPPVLQGETALHSLLRALFFLNGCYLLSLTRSAYGQLQRAANETTRTIAAVLAVWAAGAALFIVLLSPFIAVRHVLLTLFPMAMLLVWAHATKLHWSGAAVSALLGLLVATADWRYADAYRKGAADLEQQLLKEEAQDSGSPHAERWFVGHWGFQWYAKEQGWSPYVPGITRLRPGDTLIRPTLVDQQAITPHDQERLELRAEHIVRASPLDLTRTMTDRLGFYSVWHGLPWTLTLAPRERFHIYSVVNRNSTVNETAP